MKIEHKEQILNAAREKQQITHKGIPIRITADLSIKTLQARREWQDILKVMKEKNYNPDYCTQQGSHSNMKEKSKFYRQAKAERIQHHQTSSSTYAKSSSLDRKWKKCINLNPKQQSKWQQGHAAAANSLQLCPTPCDPIDGLIPGFTVPGILQSRTLEWVAISFSNA